MSLSRSCFSRRAVLAAAVGGATALGVSLPSRAQQPAPSQQTQPTVTAVVPATAAQAATTPVEYTLILPTGHQLLRRPRVRVHDAKGVLVELLPLSIRQRSPFWAGSRRLRAETYRPGTYQVDVQVQYVKPGGERATVTSSVTRLIVPPR